MNTIELLSLIDEHVKDATVDDLIELFTSPPGRKPEKFLVDVAEWRSNLSDHDRELLDRVIAESVRATLFGLFAVVDGARVVDQSVERFVICTEDREGRREPVNDTDSDLHSHFAPD